MRDRAIQRSVYLILTAVLLTACGIGPAPGDGPVGQTHAALCSAVTLSPSPGDAAPPGASIVWTADATCQFANPELEFWILDPTTGSWSVAQAYSSATTYTWQVPTVAIGSVYGWQVWAREAGSTAGYEAWAQSSFTVTAQPCTGVSATFSPTSGPAGTQVTITSSETGCPTDQAEYEIWSLAPGGSSYELLDPYSTSATYTWDTTGATPGTYDVQVWARNQGASNGYDSWAGYTYDVLADGSTPCSSVSTATSPWFVAEGTAVTLASSATGCPSPEYEVWSLAPGGSWQILQPYAASAASYAWDAPATTGTYDFQVWARDASSSSTYDAWDTFALTVNAQPAVSATTLPVGTASIDTQVTITSSATGFPNPEYEIWYLPPGGSSWQALQPYSTSASYVWDTTGATTGTYDFQVWARQQGDGDAYDGWTQFTYDLSAVAALCCPAGQTKISPLRCASVDDPAFGCGAAWKGWSSAPPAPCSGGHAQWGCSSGACAIVSCDAGFADCDGNPANGCEVDLTSSANCGSCGVACGATQMCTSSGCGTACPAPLTYCNGSCVDLTTTVAHCGACGTACSDPANGVATCSAGVCGISCNAGYTAVNGKCFNTATDPTCCGATCTACPMPYGGDAACNAGVCGQICEVGMALCSGACVDLQRDVANCGGCAVTCSGLCTGGICDTTASQIVATGQSPIRNLSADGTSLFWFDGAGNVMQVDRAGLTAPITLATGQQGLFSIALDATSVYWVNNTNGGVWMATKGAPGTTFVIAATNPQHVAVNSGYVYYDANYANFYRLPKGGSTPQLILSNNEEYYFNVDDTYFWYALGGEYGNTLWRANLDGTNRSAIANAWVGIAARPFVLASGMVSGIGNDAIFSYGETSGVGTNLYVGTPVYTGLGVLISGTVGLVAADGTYAYFQSSGGSSWPINPSGLFRAATCGGPVELIGPNSGTATAADDLWIYWADSSGGIHRVAK